MGMPGNEGTVMFSSIALLQQRFRELERVKERREERLLQMLACGEHSSGLAIAAPREAPVKWFFHPELLYPCRPLRDTAATLFPIMPHSCECKTLQLRNGSLAVDLWPNKAYKHVSSEADVDTSLHL